MSKWYLDFVPMLGTNTYKLSNILIKMFQPLEKPNEQKENNKEV